MHKQLHAMTRRQALLRATALALTLAAPAWARHPHGSTLSSSIPAFTGITAANSLIGAGGWVAGIMFCADGTAYARADTYGAYRLDPGATAWVPIVVSTSITLALGFSDGPYECVGAYSNSSYALLIVNGAMNYSTNKGATWTASSGFPSVSGTVNGGTHTYDGATRAAFDPINPLNCLAVHPTSGLYSSTNGGQTWTAVSGLATPTGYGIVCYDQSSTSGGSTQSIYVFISGSGWWHTTTGVGGTWTLTTSTPTNTTGAACSADGYLYAVSGSTTVSIYNGSSWSTATAGTSAHAVAPDPGTTGRVVAINQAYGWISVSTNHGSSWSTASTTNTYTTQSYSVGWIPWVQALDQTAGAFTHNVGNAAFNPNGSNQLFASIGIGVEWCNPSNTPASSAPAWSDISGGIENMVCNRIISPPGSGPIVGQWDRTFMRVLNPDAFPTSYLPYTNSGSNPGNLSQGWAIDWIPGATNVIVGIANYGTERSGYSTDGLTTWNLFSSDTPSNSSNNTSGSIAASSTSDIVWVGTGGSPAAELYYTTTGGSSWTLGSGAPTTNWVSNYYDYPQNYVCADRVTPSTMYAINSGHIYQSTNSGATWTSVYSGTFSTSSWYQMYSVPGQSGHLFISGAYGATSSGTAFYFSLNGGAAWSTVGGISSVWAFGFGAAYPGQSYPTVYAAGFVSGVFGVYRCTNFNPTTHTGTWTLLANYIAGNQDTMTALQGDTDVFGWAYVGYKGSGYRRLCSNDAAPWVKATSPNPGATVTRSSSVAMTATAASEIAYTSVSWSVSDGTNVATGAGLTPTLNLSGLSAGAGTVSITTTGNGQTATATIPVILA